MRTRVQRWGNRLALRIPKSFVAAAHLAQDSPIELSVIGGRLVVTPVAGDSADLDVLLAGVTEDNVRHEMDTGRAVGNEAW